MPAVRTQRGAEGSASKAKPHSDAYVGLLALSLLALSAAMVFAYLDYNSYPEAKPKPVQIAPRGGGPGPMPQGGPAVNPAQGGAPGMPAAQPAPPAGIQGNPPPAGVQGRPPAPPGPQPKQ